MSTVLFSPHNDDETLFAFYTMRRHEATLVVVLRSMRQELQQRGPTYRMREAETQCAVTIAGASGYVQWAHTDDAPDWHEIERAITGYLAFAKPDVVIAPAWEEGGHEDHNGLAIIFDTLVMQAELVRYLTYKRGHGRSEDGIEVVPSPAEKAAKMAALRCYRSQRAHPQTAPWFGPDQREFIR